MVEYERRIGTETYSMTSVISYFTWHRSKITKKFCNVEKLVNNQQYSEAGLKFSEVFAKVLGAKNPDTFLEKAAFYAEELVEDI
mmetsp:Transcript_6246/g.867  ORF Transcript_6246/g.867 Transcript_6246/m.867 type:complete len:84 (+) Transcript_6246:317-568(+)